MHGTNLAETTLLPKDEHQTLCSPTKLLDKAVVMLVDLQLPWALWLIGLEIKIHCTATMGGSGQLTQHVYDQLIMSSVHHIMV